MLKTAHLYAEELNRKNQEIWYDPEYFYYTGNPGDFDLPNVCDNSRHFVSVDKEDHVIGYIQYNINWSTLTVFRVSAVNYYKGNMIFVDDLYHALCDVFDKYHFNRLEWACVADNPAIRGYRAFIKRFGGRECGYFQRDTLLQDGRLHDSVYFEILADEYYDAKMEIQEKKESKKYEEFVSKFLEYEDEDNSIKNDYIQEKLEKEPDLKGRILHVYTRSGRGGKK